MNWTERLAKIWNLGNVKLQTRNCKLRFAVSHEKRDAKGLNYLLQSCIVTSFMGPGGSSLYYILAN